MKILSFAKRYLSILLIGSAVISCKKEVNPEKRSSSFGDISYLAKASSSSIKAFYSRSIDTVTTVDVTWSSASVYVEKISFVGISNNLLDTTIKVEKKLNIFNENALAGVIKLPAGSYKDVKVKLFCRKSMKSDLAFNFKGVFTNGNGRQDSVLVGSSFPFEADLLVTEIVIEPSNNYTAVFNFDLSKVLTGISRREIESAGSYLGKDGTRTYSIFKGGSADEPFYDQVIQNWQNVASAIVTKD